MECPTRLYRRSKKVDLTDTISICHFDAENGRVGQALDRLRDLEDEIGADAKISYAEGVIRRDFLGQGYQSFQCFVRTLELNPQHALAACNATNLATSESEFRKWHGEVMRLSPSDAPAYQFVLQALDDGKPYHIIILECGKLHSLKRKGSCAALLDIAFGGDSLVLEETEESYARRLRAQYLRDLDLDVGTLRETSGEWFPPDERLALHDAIKELDRAILLDEYDAELWNLRSAWCTLLEQYEESVTAADRAIILRPVGYPKGYHNKAVALWRLGRNEEALMMISRAQQEAQSTSNIRDLRMTESLLAAIQAESPVKGGIQQAKHILVGTEDRARQVAEGMKCNLEKLCHIFANRIAVVKGGASLEYVASVAQLLAYLPVDAAASVLRNFHHRDPASYQCCFEATCYIVSYGYSVMHRDAARVVALLILDEPSIQQMRMVCRERVLAPSAANPDEFGALADRVGEQLYRLNKDFVKLLMNQSQLTEQELQEAREGMLERLKGIPFVNNSGKSPLVTCAVLIAAVVVIVSIVVGIILYMK